MATPSDLLTLQALVAELTEQVASVQRENSRLRHQLDAALHRLYGRKTERWQPPGPEQVSFHWRVMRRRRGSRPHRTTMTSRPLPRRDRPRRSAAAVASPSPAIFPGHKR